jgi:hypothetical protein
LPTEGDCNRGAKDLGYKPEDCLLRERKLENLQEEHQAWQNLDDRDGKTAEGVTNIEQPTDSTRENCKFNDRGQDRITVQERSENSDIVYHPGPNSASESTASQSNLEESPITPVEGGAFAPTGADPNSNNDSFGYGSFTREYTEPYTHFCDEDGVTDFCYKGRVDDELLHQEALITNDHYHCHPCQLSMGTGVYYEWPVPSVMVREAKPQVFSGGATGGGEIGYKRGVQGDRLAQPYDEALPPSRNNFLGRLLRAYDCPSPKSLHYTNRPYLDQDMLDQKNYIAIQRPELNIEMSIMHFPGCRFATMGNLEEDFTHPTLRARPWDDQYSVPCGPLDSTCGTKPTYLNAELVEATNGDMLLEFDDVPFTIISNGLKPDIPSLGDHALPTDSAFDESDVVHSVYTNQFEGHEAVTLEQVCPCEDTLGDGVIEVEEALFSSARTCSDGTILDICDGYPCTSGFQNYDGEDLGRGGLFDDFIAQSEIPVSSGTGLSMLFYLISGIRHTTGVRLDCGCSVVDCGTNVTEELVTLPCATDVYLDQDGERDWNCDQIEYVPSIVAGGDGDDEIGVHCNRLNGAIPSLFELLT